MINHEIASVIARAFETYYNPDYRMLENIYGHLQREWPQINHQTKVRYVNTPVVYIESLRPMRIVESIIWVPINGLKWLRNLLFVRRDLDNPDTRWQYQTQVMTAPYLAFRPYFWRTIGQLLHRKDWVRKGMEQTFSPASPVSDIDRTMLELRQFGWEIVPAQFGYPAHVAYIACVYYPADDVLYVYQH